MSNEKALNMEYFNENLDGGKNFNLIYKKTYEKGDNIINGECFLNYLLENNYTKPFIRNNYMNYMINSNDKSFQKLNINNYKSILSDGITKKSKGPVVLENAIMKNLLGRLEENDKKNNSRSTINMPRRKINNKFKPIYLNTEGNKEIKDSFFQKYLLPKIKKENNNKNNKNNSDINNSIFKNTSIYNTIDNENKYERKKVNNKINYFSSCLRKNIFPIFKNVNDRHSLSVKKGKKLNYELLKINNDKYDINKYSYKKKNNDNIKIIDKKYHLINLFKDIGKIKSKEEIEKTLFNRGITNFKLLKDKRKKLI